MQQNRVYSVSDDTWMLGIGYTAANEVLDDLFEYVPRGGSTIGGSTALETTEGG